MRTWKKAVIVNFAAIVGAASTMFIVPQSMSLWLWVSICLAAVAFVNYVVIYRTSPAIASSRFPGWKSWAAVGLFLFFILDLVYSYYHK